MKTGKNDLPSEAASQNDKALAAMKMIADGAVDLRLAERVGKNTLGRDLTGAFDLSGLKDVRSASRGVLGKGFDRDIPFDRKVLEDIVMELVKPKAHAKRVLPASSTPTPLVTPRKKESLDKSSP